MIARILWLAALLAVAVVTTGLQMDRQTRNTPSLAANVPEPFRSNAQLPFAAFTIDAGSPEIALREAQKLVLRRPMPAEHLRVLAQAQFAAGDLDASALTIQYAAQRGWRDSLAQESMLRLAIAAGDGQEAGRRFGALLVMQDSDEEKLREFANQVLAEPGGTARATLIEIIGGAERWQNRFLLRGPRVMNANAFAEIAGSLIEAGTDFDCPALNLAIRNIGQQDEAAAADLSNVAAKTCPEIAADGSS